MSSGVHRVAQGCPALAGLEFVPPAGRLFALVCKENIKEQGTPGLCQLHSRIMIIHSPGGKQNLVGFGILLEFASRLRITHTLYWKSCWTSW